MQSDQTPTIISGPINGANLTADTRNYPWHRPAEVSGFNESVTKVIEEIDEDREGELIYSLLKMEMPVSDITANVLMRRISKGVIPIDTAIIIAGPIARYIEILAKDNGITPDMNMDSEERAISAEEIKANLGMPLDLGLEEDEMPVEDEAEEDSVEGLMSAPTEGITASSEEQLGMLGGAPTEEQGVL